eukprot:comp24232_c5_seq1/m.44706 comp24232_c5_seq1/g.44706  ORF comp24232_c5_seq1/g.44706 comp24232_c5_seq1/m.44706 type:complete len:426 (-) comp24232_c5_seq1:856-2133(-)
MAEPTRQEPTLPVSARLSGNNKPVGGHNTLVKLIMWVTVPTISLICIWQYFQASHLSDIKGLSEIVISELKSNRSFWHDKADMGKYGKNLSSLWVDLDVCEQYRLQVTDLEYNQTLNDTEWILSNMTSLEERSGHELFTNWLSPTAQSWLTASCPEVVAHHKRVPYFRYFDDVTLRPLATAEYAAVGVCMLKLLSERLDREGLHHILIVGTALGAHRHHGMIPWDDDIDIAAPLAQITRFSEVLHDLAKDGFRWKPLGGQKIKLWHELAPPVLNPNYVWHTPCIDIFLYKDEENEAPWFYRGEWYPIYYLRYTQRLYFGGAWLPVPILSIETLTVTFTNLSMCMDKGYNHRHEASSLSLPWIKVFDCCRLAEKVPFVFRERHLWNSTEPFRGVTEELRVGNTTIHKVVYDENGVGTVVPYPITSL